MIPTSGVFKQSEVFKTLNSELVQAEEDKDKKWTTFMQKPSRPAPKTREERMRELNPPSERYQVRIVKQPKPKIAPDYKPPKSPVSFVRMVASIVSCSFLFSFLLQLRSEGHRKSVLFRKVLWPSSALRLI